MIKRKYCVLSEINCSIKNAKAYFIPCDKTSQTSNLLVVYLLLEAKTVLSAEKMWHVLWREIDFYASLPWATCHSGSSVFQVINSFPNQYFWWSFSTLGPLNLASSPRLKQAWMFHSWMCKYLLPPQVLRKKKYCETLLFEQNTCLHLSCAFEESAMASFLFSESQSIKGDRSRRGSLWEGDFPKNALSDFCSFNEKQLQECWQLSEW